MTPMMAQYQEVKAKYPDCLVFFRMGDFYELFFEDAVKAAAALDITLTRRGKADGEDIPMCGVPFHACEAYLARLIKQGFRVAVCEQSADLGAKKGGKTLMRRDVVRIVTPGTLTEEALLDAKSNNYLVALAGEMQSQELFSLSLSLAAVDLSTGEFFLEEALVERLPSLLMKYNPREILLTEALYTHEDLKPLVAEWREYCVILSAASFDVAGGERRLKEAYKVLSLEGWGSLSSRDIAAAGAVIDYVLLTQKGRLPRLDRPKKVLSIQRFEMDGATRRNLELLQTLSGERKGSLLHLMDRTVTSSGARLLAQRLSTPLVDVSMIAKRLETVAWMVKNTDLREIIRKNLREVSDIERALSRLSLGRGGPRDLASLRDTLCVATQLQAILYPGPQVGILSEILEIINACRGHDVILHRLSDALADELPLLARDGGFIRAGYHPELDEVRKLRDHGRQHIIALQSRYIQETGVQSLKIKHNNILGYYVEVTSTNASKMPHHFIHRQTMAGAMRFTTVELAELEGKINAASDNALQIELNLFAELEAFVLSKADSLIDAARALASLDVAAALAELAVQQKYCCPGVDESLDFIIEGGRHPMVESLLSQPFISNSCDLNETQRLWLITGPNMAGKSTFLRQNALIVVMAQMGSFVPAQKARIGVVDRLFSRVGAADDLARGRSTFMVEMVETATILNQATARSLVILDEVGRGTATYDGMSIAWAVVEHLGNVVGCRSLFATHYHELTALTKEVKGLSCWTMKIREWRGEVVFMHEIIAGTADRSYGLHVARLAGLPEGVLQRAQEILERFEKTKSFKNEKGSVLPLFEYGAASSVLNQVTPSLPPADPLREELEQVDLDNLTPRQAHELLYRLKESNRHYTPATHPAQQKHGKA